MTVFWVVLGILALAYVVGGWECHSWLSNLRDKLEDK